MSLNARSGTAHPAGKFIHFQECNVKPDDLELEAKLKNFEKLGWTRRKKMTTSERKAAEAANLPPAGLVYRYELPEFQMGDRNTEGSTTIVAAKQDVAAMPEDQATIAFTPGCDCRPQARGLAVPEAPGGLPPPSP